MAGQSANIAEQFETLSESAELPGRLLGDRTHKVSPRRVGAIARERKAAIDGPVSAVWRVVHECGRTRCSLLVEVEDV